MTKPSLYKKIIFSYAAWWLLWAVLQILVIKRFNLNLNITLADAGITNLLMALSGLVIINTYRFYTPGRANYIYGAIYIVVLAFISVTASHFILQQLFTGETGYLNFINTSLPLRYLFTLLMFAFIAVVSWLRFYMNNEQENKKRKDEAENLLRDAELTNLRQQLQPHFLFNSLNSISALAGSRPDEARKMIQQLSDFLRGTLKKDDQQLITFAEELEHLQLYLEIEKVRFGHRLNVAIACNDACMNLQLPTLLLQPIVENAIKFGLYDTTDDIIIKLTGEVKENQLIITIQNPFDTVTAKPKEGVGFGLNAVQRRLYLLYARHDLLTIKQQENLFITTLKIPQSK